MHDKNLGVRVTNNDKKNINPEQKQTLFAEFITQQSQQLLNNDNTTLQSSLKEPKDVNEYLIASYVQGKHDSIKLEEDKKPIWKQLWNKEGTITKPTQVGT